MRHCTTLVCPWACRDLSWGESVAARAKKQTKRIAPTRITANIWLQYPVKCARFGSTAFRRVIAEYRMSNDRKNADVNERGSAEKKDADRPDDAKLKPGQSQDASRHQHDAAHHKGYKGPQPGTK